MLEVSKRQRRARKPIHLEVHREFRGPSLPDQALTEINRRLDLILERYAERREGAT